VANERVRSLPPINTLMAFESAARLGSFSEAADELALTQSAISQQIRKLEDLVEQRLFFRKGSGVRLTAAGGLLFETVSKMLGDLAAGFDRIEPYKNEDSALLVCPADFAHGWLMARLGDLHRIRRAVEVWVITRDEARAIDRIDVDLIVSRRPIHTADVESVPLLEDKSIAVCGRGLAARLAKLPFPAVVERAPLLMLEDEPDWGGFLRDRRLRGKRLNRVATIDSSVLLIGAVERDLGVGYVSNILALTALQEGRVIRLPAIPSTSRPRLWLMRTRLKPRTPVADFAFNWLRDTAAGDVGS
jgi:LysR family transcriptional regulator, glycine cleavage system transcriptional activator